VTLSEPQTLIFLSVDDFFLRNEWAGDVPVVSSRKIKPEQDFRILDLFEDFDVSATFFIPGIIADLFPERVRDVANRGFEVAAHGYRHENLTFLEEADRRQLVMRSVKILEKCIDKNVLGWRSPGLHIDDSLYRVLKETHVEWCSNVELPLSLKHVPFMFKGKTELPILSIDLKLYGSGLSPARVCDNWLANLQKGHAVFTLVLHPWVQLNELERFNGLRLFLEKAVTMEKVKFCSGSEIYYRFVLQGSSVYGTILSSVSNLWKRFSRRAQRPILRAQKLLHTQS
jgi:peptidoglycan/xylan/chitin deacetylase (PgdA/CDA1 family)